MRETKSNCENNQNSPKINPGGVGNGWNECTVRTLASMGIRVETHKSGSKIIFNDRADKLEGELKTARATITEFMGRTAIAELTVERLYRELTPSDDGAVVVKVFYIRGDDPFVFFINGAISIGGIEEIEKECGENCLDMFEDGEGEYMFKAIHGGGDEHIKPYWDIEKLAFSPIRAILAAKED